MTHSGLKYMLMGIILMVAGIAFIAAEVSFQGFLWGTLYSGIWGILAPFVLVFLGATLVYLGISAKEQHYRRKKEPKPVTN